MRRTTHAASIRSQNSALSPLTRVQGTLRVTMYTLGEYGILAGVRPAETGAWR
jgi:hypothetical protein